MKKSLLMMCIGGMLALCTPLTASDAKIDPPVVKGATPVKVHHPAEETIAPTPGEAVVAPVADSEESASHPQGGGVVVISGTALLLIIILLILLL